MLCEASGGMGYLQTPNTMKLLKSSKTKLHELLKNSVRKSNKMGKVVNQNLGKKLLVSA